MIKASLNEMMPVYHKLFNIVLNGGSMPLMWCSGLITPILKSGVRNDPTMITAEFVSLVVQKIILLNFKPKAYGTCQLVDHTSQFSNRLFTKNRTADHVLQGRIQKFQKEDAESHTLPLPLPLRQVKTSLFRKCSIQHCGRNRNVQ